MREEEAEEALPWSSDRVSLTAFGRLKYRLSICRSSDDDEDDDDDDDEGEWREGQLEVTSRQIIMCIW